jgi:ABC-type nitrate/sulfonate/bicarbonate transport system substrate-binding protein
MYPMLRRGALIGLLATLALWPAGAAFALDKIRLGKAVPNSFAFGAAEVGIEAKIFEQEGLEIEVTSFRGDAQLQQALAAGSIDVGLGSGPGLGFRAKGAPAIGVAAMYGPPANLALVLPFETPIKTVSDLKGKRIGVTTTGSLTDWLVRELSRQQGWGSDGIQILALGQMQARLAAIQRGELDGMVIEAATGYELEEAGKARNFILFGDIAKDFYTHVIFATDDIIDKQPNLLRRLEPGGDRRHQAFAQGARNPRRRAGSQGDLQRPVRSGAVLTRATCRRRRDADICSQPWRMPASSTWCSMATPGRAITCAMPPISASSRVTASRWCHPTARPSFSSTARPKPSAPRWRRRE